MADNVILNTGTGGATAAADDIGGVHHQRVKISVGGDGSANDAIPVSNGLDTTAAGVLAAGMVGQLDDTATGAVTENQFAPVRISSRRALLVEGVASGTVIPISDGGGSITVDGAVTATGGATEAKQDTIIGHVDGIEASLTTLAGTVRAEDDASANAHTGIVVLAKRSDTPAATSGTDGDYEPVQVTGGRVATSAVVTSLPASTNTIEVVGDAAHDAAAAGNPLLLGAKAETALSGVTAVTDGDVTNLYAGADGVLITRPYCGLEDILSGVDTDTDGSSTSVISAAGAGIRIYVTSVIVKNTHATTDAYVDIRDGTAGSVLASIPAPAAGGAIVAFPVPLRFSANTAVAVDPSAAVTTIITTVVGFKAAV